jgi:hypothetical protein
VEGSLVDTARFHTDEGRLEQSLWATETLVADGDDLHVNKIKQTMNNYFHFVEEISTCV